MIYVFIILSIILSISSIYLFKEKKKEQKEKEKIEAEFQIRADQAVAEHLEKSKASIEQTLEAIYNQKKIEFDEKQQILQTALESQQGQISQLKENERAIMEEYKSKMIIELSAILNEAEIKEFDRTTAIIEAYISDARHRKELVKKEEEEILNELNDYRAKRDALNAEILRQRTIEEKEGFYKIQIDEASLHDMALLDEIKSQFSKFDLIQKLEYDNYVSKSAQEMVKRVLEGKKPCGIYKVTRLKTGEVYIGKSTDVASRWIQHCKSCYHCGTISHSTFHSTLEKDGIQNFTWELLEEVEKDKLTEREKYWIEFYDSKKYGMNEKVG